MPSPVYGRRRGCRLYVAAAGYGKTTQLETATDCEKVDDFGMLDEAAQLRLARELCALPDDTLMLIASHEPLAAVVEAALPQPCSTRTAAALAMTEDVVAMVLREEYGVVDSELAHQVAELTGGWPALVSFAGAALARQAIGYQDLVAALTSPGSAAAAWLHDEVLGRLPKHVYALLRSFAELDPITAELCTHLGSEGFDWLVQTGLLIGDREYRVVPALAAMLARCRQPDDAEHDLAAAAWYREHGYPLAAAQAFLRAGEKAECVRLVEAAGEQMPAVGVVKLVSAIPWADRSERLMLLLGDAQRVTGDVTAAMSTFEPLLARAERTGEWPPALIWRVAMVHYMRSQYRTALEICERCAVPDDALVLACHASTLAMLGDPAAAETAKRSLAAADSDRAFAAAHLATALTESGGRRDQHLAEAQAAAQRAGDLALLTRVLLNQAVGHAREAQYAAALDVSARAVRAAERGAPPGMYTVALVNAGSALTMLGRFDEAALRFDRAVQVARRVGLHRVAMGLAGLAELHHLRGQHERGRAMYEEAVDLARAAGDRQVLVAALVKLALVLAARAADLPAARAAADEAEQLAPSSAFIAQGYVALAEGDTRTARQHAAAAITASRAGRRADSLAEALELSASACDDPAEARAALREAEAIWRRGGAVVAADLVHLKQARTAGANAEQRAAGKAAAKRLQALGVHVADAPGGANTVRIQVLGGFEVVACGQPVPLTAWRSRQARSLLKILVARRGRPVPRGELCELLWPDDDTRRTAHRLSVLLSMIRSVLDPAHAWPVDRHIRADSIGIFLDTDHVTVDAEELLRDSDFAAQLLQENHTARAREVLEEISERCGSDAFDDEPYEDWARGLREEVRAVGLRALRQLATLTVAAGELDQAVTLLVRLRTADPFDEPVHRQLVTSLSAAGRHGEARRAFDQWAEAMRSIDVPGPDQSLLLTPLGSRNPGRTHSPGWK